MPMILVLEDDPELNQTITSVLKKKAIGFSLHIPVKKQRTFQKLTPWIWQCWISIFPMETGSGFADG